MTCANDISYTELGILALRATRSKTVWGRAVSYGSVYDIRAVYDRGPELSVGFDCAMALGQLDFSSRNRSRPLLASLMTVAVHVWKTLRRLHHHCPSHTGALSWRRRLPAGGVHEMLQREPGHCFHRASGNAHSRGASTCYSGSDFRGKVPKLRRAHSDFGFCSSCAGNGGAVQPSLSHGRGRQTGESRPRESLTHQQHGVPPSHSSASSSPPHTSFSE